nr:venom protein [Lampona murina]
MLNTVNMLWTSSLLILIFVGGSLSNECEHVAMKARDECDGRNVLNTFPETAEEVMKVCEKVQTVANCIIDVHENCGESERDDIVQLRHVADYLSSLCHENNPTFKAISDNVQCMKPVAEKMEGHCISMYREEAFEDLKSLVMPYYEDEENELLNCLDWYIVDSKCRAITLGYHCGEDVGDAAEEILLGLYNSENSKCSAENMEELKPIFDTFERVILDELESSNQDTRSAHTLRFGR